MAIATATFLVALAVIASERVHRTKVALLGAAIVVLFAGGEFDQEHAIESVEHLMHVRFQVVGFQFDDAIAAPGEPRALFRARLGRRFGLLLG